MVPSRVFASGFDSSNQLDVLVASFVSEIWAERSAANVEVERFSSAEGLGAVFEAAVTRAVLRRRLMRRPSSSVDV